MLCFKLILLGTLESSSSTSNLCTRFMNWEESGKVGSWKSGTCLTSENQHDVLTTGKFSSRSSLRKSVAILQYPWGIDSGAPADTKSSGAHIFYSWHSSSAFSTNIGSDIQKLKIWKLIFLKQTANCFLFLSFKAIILLLPCTSI